MALSPPSAGIHLDRDFATIAGVTGQYLRWYGPD
jgi:hypothetical protein